MLKQFLANFFFPKKDIAYFSVYTDFWKETVYERKRTNIALIKLLILLTLFMATKYVLIELFNPSTAMRIVLYDGFNLALPNQRGLSAMVAALCLLVSCLLQICYLKGEPFTSLFLEEMLFQGKARSFLWQRYNSKMTVCEYLIDFANQLLKANTILRTVICK